MSRLCPSEVGIYRGVVTHFIQAGTNNILT